MQFWEHHERFELSNVKALLYKMASDFVVSHYRRQDIRLDFSRNIQLDKATISPEEQLQFEELSQKYAIINAAFQQENAYGQKKGKTPMVATLMHKKAIENKATKEALMAPARVQVQLMAVLRAQVMKAE